MYESQTYGAILQRMLLAVPDDIDKRPGSIIYDALAPAALELSEIYVNLDRQLKEVFPQTASDNNLDLLTEPFGQERNQATYAVRKAVFTGQSGVSINVPIGSRFSISGVTYRAILRITSGQFELECEQSGSIGNQYFGTMIPIDYVDGLVVATLADVLIPGVDRESDDDYRTRFFLGVRLPATSGNKADYRKWALEVDGVGGAQVIPLWNGPGTVKVIIIDAEKLPASPTLVSIVQDYISPADGTGEGVAPVGADVNVVAATSVLVNITGTIVRDGSRTIVQIEEDFASVISSYLASIAFIDNANVLYAKLGAMLLDVAGVDDYTALQLNGATGNITILSGQVAVLGTVNLS
ncbi:baseplate J/gp47 family protein [Paenibacillus sp. WC2504]|uniref:baseplate J/gp47 family protein n=1 Tax=Paenibacillus sp. WC2504 TaxID=3461403 RepID=UPI004045CF34